MKVYYGEIHKKTYSLHYQRDFDMNYAHSQHPKRFHL